MSSEANRTWQEVAASNRERIRALEHELERVRETVHKLTTDTAAILYLTREVAKLETAVEDLAEQLARVARRAVEKPTATGLSIAAQYLSFFVALIALAIAATR